MFMNAVQSGKRIAHRWFAFRNSNDRSGARDESVWAEKRGGFLCFIYGCGYFMRFIVGINTRSCAKEGTEGANGTRLSKSKGKERDHMAHGAGIT